MRRAGADRRARRLVRWYPKEWRARYGEEFTQLLTDDIRERPRSWHRTLDVARSGLAAQMAQRQPARSRLAGAALIFGAALAGAAVLRGLVDPNRQIKCPHGRNPQADCLIVPPHGWVDSAALVIALLGLAAAAGLVITPRLRPRQRRIAGAAAIVGAAAGVLVWVATYRQPVPIDGFPGYPGKTISPSPAWAVAAAVLIGIAAIGVALTVLRHRRALTRLRLATMALILGLALAGALTPHVVADPGGRFMCDTRFPPGMGCGLVAVRRWVEPAAVALCALAVVGAAGVLVTGRRG